MRISEKRMLNRIFEPKGRKQKEYEENCKMRGFMISFCSYGVHLM